MAHQDMTLPSYQEIPTVKGMPHGCAWGFWDSYGDSQPDELGTLNLLTPDRVLEAKKEIQLGIRVAINWPLNNCSTPHSNRRKPEHQIVPLPGWEGNDDEIHMNTQSGSQWDGFREFSILPLLRQKFTNGQLFDRALGPPANRLVLQWIDVRRY
jgi:hypothetical protein